MSVLDDRLAAMFAAPFAPANVAGNGPSVDSAIRLANAAEYAAAQLGIIARAAERIEVHWAKIAAHYPVPGSTDDVVMQQTKKR